VPDWYCSLKSPLPGADRLLYICPAGILPGLACKQLRKVPMDKLLLLTQLCGILTLLALLWLTIHASRKHPGWGFLVLLLSPIGASIFGIRHWADEKKPFLAYITSFTLTLSLAIFLFSSWGGWELLQAYQRVQEGTQARNLSRDDATAFIHASLDFSERSGLNTEDQQQFIAVRRHLEALDQAEQAAAEQEAALAAAKEAEAADGEPLTLATISKKVQEKNERYRLMYKPIQISEAGNYVGYTVKVVRKGVQEKEYRLTGATASRLKFAQRNSYGTYSFSYRTRDIEKIRVLVKQPY